MHNNCFLSSKARSVDETIEPRSLPAIKIRKCGCLSIKNRFSALAGWHDSPVVLLLLLFLLCSCPWSCFCPLPNLQPVVSLIVPARFYQGFRDERQVSSRVTGVFIRMRNGRINPSSEGSRAANSGPAEDPRRAPAAGDSRDNPLPVSRFTRPIAHATRFSLMSPSMVRRTTHGCIHPGTAAAPLAPYYSL